MMKVKNFIYLFLFISLFSCTKKLDTGYFTMDMPYGWSYEPGNGTDSFVGTITTSSGTISFDYSTMGYASSLIATEQQYLTDEKNWSSSTCYFCDPDVTYVPKEKLEAETKRLMQQQAIKGALPIKVEANIEYTKKIRVPDDKWRRYYPGADYIADLKYKDSTIYVPIRIPQSIKSHNIRLDTTQQYIIKTIWPQTATEGKTGVYIKSRTSQLNFNMVGDGLSEGDQEKALKAFKTITLKK
ncbi:hypothetical protein BDD43_4108 [Mucilaginibacter gracilis]|uniref:DUF4136 domain-containing protein n=1 Tax=Mucilaginibacter gracilis TaxID=423350 RepID=A0A495J563_9SPHI|nr:hypothetical protein [Mucilaginibacter gracilis]RKR83893.1 hypothetical protein BDD43_4108 [Mucilaginibacter gracilis]